MIRGVASGGVTGGVPVVGGTANSILYVDSSGNLKANDTNLTFGGTAGKGVVITAGTATSAVQALSVTQTRNYNGAATDYIKYSFTETSTHASDNYFAIYGGAAASTQEFAVAKGGGISVTGSSLFSNAISMNGWYGFPQGGNGGIAVSMGSGNRVTWSSSASDPTGASADTGLSRVSAGVVGVGTSAAGSVAGTIAAASFKTSTALITATDGGSTAAFTANMVGSTGGPTTAAQNGWVKMQDSNGATVWVPVWK